MKRCPFLEEVCGSEKSLWCVFVALSPALLVLNERHLSQAAAEEHGSDDAPVTAPPHGHETEESVELATGVLQEHIGDRVDDG